MLVPRLGHAISRRSPSGRRWRDFIRALVRFARVLFFDMRGVGMSSSRRTRSHPIETWMDDLVAVTGRRGIGQRRRSSAHGQQHSDGRHGGRDASRPRDLARPRERVRAVRAGRRLPGRHAPRACRRSTSRTSRRSGARGRWRRSSGPRSGSDLESSSGGGGWSATARARRLARARAEAMLRRRRPRTVCRSSSVPTLVVHSRDNEYVTRRSRPLPRGAHRGRDAARA